MTAELFGRNLVKDKSQIEGNGGAKWMTMQRGSIVRGSGGVIWCILIHQVCSVIPTPLCCSHQNCIARKVKSSEKQLKDSALVRAVS